MPGKTVKTMIWAIVSTLLVLSNVYGETYQYDENYADVNCQYQWGGTICDCENLKYLMRLPTLHGNIRQIHVKNCGFFLVPQDSLADLTDLNTLIFENIDELEFQKFSFNSTRRRPSIRLEIDKANVPNLPSHLLKGNLEELIITNSNISKIHAFAFTGIFNEISAVRIKNTTIQEIEAQAFKKLTILNLEIIDTTFQTNSVSRTFYDCHIQNIFIENSRFSMLNPSTFDVKEVQRLTIFNSTFGIIEGEAFMMDVSDRAIFSNNHVTMLHHSAFRGITMHPKSPDTRTQEVYFEFNNNQVDFVHPEQDISFCPDMKLQVSKLYLRDPRNCESVSRIYENKFFNENSNSVFMRVEDNDENFETISYLSDRCRTDSKWFLILMILLGIVVLLLILIPAIFCYLRNKRKHNIIILPEPRTYKQTQIVMQVETHGLIKTDF